MKKTHYIATLKLIVLVIFLIASAFIFNEKGLYKHDKNLIFAQETILPKKSESAQVNILIIGTCFIANEDEPQTVFFPALMTKKIEEMTGKKVNIIVKSSSGLSTATAAKNIESWLSEYHYDLVLTSLGSGDFYNNLFYQEGSVGSFENFVMESNIGKKMQLYFTEYKKDNIHSIVTNIEEQRVAELEKELAKLNIESEDFIVKSLYLTRLYYEYEKLDQGRELLRKIKYDNHTRPSLLAELAYDFYLFNLPKEADKVKQLAQASPESFKYMQNAMSADGQPLNQEGREITLLKYMDDPNLFPSFSYNYNTLIEKIKTTGVPVVAIQYPKRENDLLRHVLKNHPDIQIIDNEKIFIDAEKKYGYKGIYANNWFGDFGTLTNLGHEIIADNIVQFLKKNEPSLFQTP